MQNDKTSSEELIGEFKLSPTMFWVAALMLTTANFIAVLNMTIANVSVPHIAGNLGATASQGTWVITAYAIGEAITVPLTGWFAARFGAVKVFVVSMVMFGLFSIVCGLSDSLGLLVVARIFQGFSGGPLMPLSQTLLLRLFPKEKAGVAIGMWSMTTLVAPVLGPIVGGYVCDEYSWPWVFFLNSPIVIICGFFAWQLLKDYVEPLIKKPIDVIGLFLLIIWVVCLQLVLDEGKDLDWFSSDKIVILSIISFICFVSFIIWEFYEEHPVVDLKIFRHRGFTISVMTVSLAFGAYFGANVLTPLWLQTLMGYTGTQAGLAACWTGIAGLTVAPFVAKAATTTDARKLVFVGVLWLGLMTFWRGIANTDMAFIDVMLPLLFMGFGLPFFFIPAMGLSLSSVEKNEVDSAAGLLNFVRTLSGAFSTSFVATAWSNKAIENHANLVAITDSDNSVRIAMEHTGMSTDLINQTINMMINKQSVMLATNQVMITLSVVFVFAALMIWGAPKPVKIPKTTGGH
ncbi:drug resistance transporter, EmrB/QacA subfamily [Arcobacter nitrofigilis DSM 7299]|uniref:Drug resistance transporter, EmrB/QacA subfamily n=1 Tax=Arcobacter nitrofigilis (strain ATCC 33309 / DSM 7299 / CCUG 15893 / LMG 7604 / NCTC 12251 / CI) TaxID=572480 RepID=D5V0X0_ARCNC|nr:DHA2 family efflux MFS transporter permease subunit [Arcobacter nitrofigilis]ADG93932.1 drug resistance transporter, EmrB/QacA subfamily [Arcobacter nitrofigilis DSM 7299]